MQVIERLAPLGHKCRPGINRTGFLGITIHNTSNYSNGANALAHANLLRGSWKDKYVSWNYVVDKDYAVRCVPENEVAWCQGDGNGNGNMKTISIEICDNADGNIRTATDNAVALAADILKRNGVSKASSFLFQHNHWTGKDCPYDIRRGNPYDWNTFVSKVQAILDGKNRKIGYEAHIQNVGWQGWKYDGETAGTTGKSLRMEAIKINYKGEVYAKAHIQNKGWVDYGKITKDTVIGTTGQGLRLEALCLKGNFKYRVHIAEVGWSCWTNADGICTLGSVGQALRIEAIQIKEI